MANNSPVGRKENRLSPSRTVKPKLSRSEIFAKNAWKLTKHVLAQFGSAILAVAIVAYMFLQLMLNIGTVLDTETAVYVDISDKAEVRAFLFRDEKVISAPVSGSNVYLAEDGEKVRRGEEIAITYSSGDDVLIQQRIQEIDKRISVLEKSSLSTGASTTNITMLDSSISELTAQMIRYSDENKFDRILREKEELLILMNRRQAIVQAADYSEELNDLREEKEILNSRLSGSSVVTVSPESGYFYSGVDGYENYFTIERLNSMSAEDFETLSEAVPDNSVISSSSGKIVLGSKWYIAVSLDKRSAEVFETGSSYPVTFQYSNNTVLDMTVDRKLTRGDRDVTVVVFSTRQLPKGFDFSRSQTVELPRANHEGLRISTNSLRIKDGETGVYTVVGTKVVFKKTEVLYTYGSYSVCAIPTDPNYPDRKDRSYFSSTRLSLHDSVIVGGNDIYDGMRIK